MTVSVYRYEHIINQFKLLYLISLHIGSTQNQLPRKILLLHAKTVHGAKQSLCKLVMLVLVRPLLLLLKWLKKVIHCGSVLGELTLYSCALLIQNSCMQLHPGTNLIALFPGLPHFFVVRFVFSIKHGSGTVYYTERKPKNKKMGEAWERGYKSNIAFTAWYIIM